jgi:hypothetical protein
MLMDQLDLQGMEEGFHRGIVIAAARPAHRWLGAHESQLLDIRLSRILASTDALLNVKQ